SYVPDTYNFICWGICEAPFNHKAGKHPFYILKETVTVTNSYLGFSGHYLPQGTKGSSEYRYVFYDITNPTDSCWFNVVYNTNLNSNNEIQAENNVKVYPNPAHDRVFIESKIDLQQADIQIFNCVGEKQNVVLKNNFIETSTFQNGFYFIKIKIGTQETVKRFLIF
ncbi:MAG: Secretion system C-terminal sorting domain, partial [Bacteroidota bacterium]